MGDSDREAMVIDLLNRMINCCEPFTYEQFNHFVKQKNNELIELEGVFPEVGIAGKEELGMSTLSIIATITDILTDKRLAFIMDKDNVITGVKWYENI